MFCRTASDAVATVALDAPPGRGTGRSALAAQPSHPALRKMCSCRTCCFTCRGHSQTAPSAGIRDWLHHILLCQCVAAPERWPHHRRDDAPAGALPKNPAPAEPQITSFCTSISGRLPSVACFDVVIWTNSVKWLGTRRLRTCAHLCSRMIADVQYAAQ